MDTEFPGTVFSVDNMTDDFYYKGLKKKCRQIKINSTWNNFNK